MTPWEKKLWYQFLKDYPVRFQRQKAIGNYIADFYCAKARLIVEVDGQEHFEKSVFKYDSNRAKELENCGLKVVRVSNYEIKDKFENVCKYIDSEVKKSLPQSAALTAPSSEGAD